MKVLSFDLNDAQVKEVRHFIKRLTEHEPAPYRECPYYDRCESQICPMDPLKHKRIWYASEGLCLNPEYRNDQAVISQRKLAKKNPPGYFTYGMLDRDFLIRKGITGVDPDVQESVYRMGQNAIDLLYAERERAWLHGHPELTDEQREKMRTKGMAGLEALKRYRENRSDPGPQADSQGKK